MEQNKDGRNDKVASCKCLALFLVKLSQNCATKKELSQMWKILAVTALQQQRQWCLQCWKTVAMPRKERL